MPGSLPAIDTVVSVGVVEALELLVRGDKGIHQIYGILVMDIIVPRAMDQEKIALQLIHMGDRAVVVITHCVKLWSLQVPFSINGIIISPSRYRCHGNGGFKDIISHHQRKGRHVSAVGPTPDPDSAAIHERQGSKVFCCRNLILCFYLSQIGVSDIFKSFTPGT